MFIGVCGYGATGSSALVGLLKEYPELKVCDNAEIQEAFRIDGLQDLEYHLVKQYSCLLYTSCTFIFKGCFYNVVC